MHEQRLPAPKPGRVESDAAWAAAQRALTGRTRRRFIERAIAREARRETR